MEADIPVEIRRCGICGGANLRYLGVRPGDGTVICGCGAHWWNSWMTGEEWFERVDEGIDLSTGRISAIV